MLSTGNTSNILHRFFHILNLDTSGPDDLEPKCVTIEVKQTTSYLGFEIERA